MPSQCLLAVFIALSEIVWAGLIAKKYGANLFGPTEDLVNNVPLQELFQIRRHTQSFVLFILAAIVL